MGLAKQQRERLPGSLCPDTLAKKIVKLNVWDLEGVFNSAIGALPRPGFLASGSQELPMAPIW